MLAKFSPIDRSAHSRVLGQQLQPVSVSMLRSPQRQFVYKIYNEKNVNIFALSLS